jgi:hypothetical protein
MRLIGLSLLAVATAATPAAAQFNNGYNGGYTIQRPGQLPTFVNPTFGGGYVYQTPGQVPTFANPTYGGGYVIQTPGRVPTFVNPTNPFYR